MSRTYRNPHSRWYHYSNRTVFIEDRMNRFYTGYAWIKTLKPKAQYAAEVKKAIAEYEAEVKKWGGTTKTDTNAWGTWTYTIHRRRPSKYKYVKVTQSEEEARKKYGEEFDRLFYDGHFNETPRKSGYKREAKRYTRRQNKNFCMKVMKEDWEDEAYPNCFDGKRFVWNWW